MRLIPLVRPIFPLLSSVSEYFQASRATGQYSNFGPAYKELKKKIDAITRRENVFTANGTLALQIAISATFKEGSKIAIPDYTHVGTLAAVIGARCIPIIFPCDRRTWCIDPLELSIRVGHIDGFIVVSPFGYSVDFKLYDNLAVGLHRKVIYDLAGAWGIEIKTKNPVSYSLHATKNFSCGEGGIASFNSWDQAEIARMLTNFDTLLDRSVASPLGSNFKMDELKCAVVLAHLENNQREITSRIHRKMTTIEYYQKALPSILEPSGRHEQGAPSLCVFQSNIARKIESECEKYLFQAKRYYLPLAKMPGLSQVSRLGEFSSYFENCIALPSDVNRREADVVVKAIQAMACF